jgi:hypothetical protein
MVANARPAMSTTATVTYSAQVLLALAVIMVTARAVG